MIDFAKKLFSSKLFLLFLSIIMLWVMSLRVDFKDIYVELTAVSWWFVAFNLFYQFFVLSIIAYRWTILIFDKPRIIDVWNFVRGIYIGMFYSLFFPSSGSAIDAIKWLPIVSKYPHFKKRFVLGTMLVDRLMTLCAFYLMALIGVSVASISGYIFPIYVFWLVLAIFISVFSFGMLVFFGKIQKMKKISFIISDRTKMVKCFLLGIVTEVLWLVPVWWISNYFDAGMSLLSVYLFMPIIMTVLILPISFSGFGAREYMYSFFFSQLGVIPEKAVLVSSFFGTIGVVSCLVGGIFPVLDKKMMIRRNNVKYVK